MSTPYITPKQSFNLTVGSYFSAFISHTGTGPLTWFAVSLPSGLTVNVNTGEIAGTPIKSENRSAYIILTNSEGTNASIISFTIKEATYSNLTFGVSPEVGYARATRYQFTTNSQQTLSSYSLLWSFGDGSMSSEINPTHIYELPGNYTISLFAYVSSGVVSLSSNLNVNLIINESIYFDVVPPPTFAGHYNRYPFKINFTSSKEGPHYIDLAAQFSRSYQTQEPRNKWSFLRPEWRFLDLDGNPIKTIIPKEDKIYSNALGKINSDGDGLVAGVTGSAEFYFVDDIYNYDLFVEDKPYTTLIATLRTNEIRAFNDSFNADKDLPGFSNSLATVSCPYIFMVRIPDNVRITENGIRDYINPRWPQSQQPILINTNNIIPYPDNYEWNDGSNGIKILNPEYEFCHSIPLSGNLSIKVGTTGFNSNFIPQPTEFKWIDETGYKTPGYYKGTFFTTTASSLNSVITGSVDIEFPALSTQYYNPMLWISNPEAGLMTVAQYIYNPVLSAAMDTPNMNVAVVKTFEMPIINDDEVDFSKDAMALSGIHGICSIAAMQSPTYHAWALDSELNNLYRLTTRGDILCAIDINKVVSDNNLGFWSYDQVSPASVVLDSKQDIWVTLYDTISTLKFDRYGNFLFAITPTSAIGYGFPPAPAIDGNWYSQTSYYEYDENSPYDYNLPNNEANSFIEPTGIDTDTEDNVWVTYSYFASGYLIKYDSSGNLLYSHSYPVCSCPQEIVIDKDDNVWVALSNNIWSTKECSLEKRNSNGVLLSSVYPIIGLNHLTLDTNQNPWFTFSYDWIGSVDNSSGTLFTLNLSGVNKTAYAPDWFDPNINTDETALEGIGCDLKGRIYVINSIENQIYVLDKNTKQILNRFYINPRGFTFYLEDQSSPTIMNSSIWNKSLQATGDWTGLRWVNKYGKAHLPYFTIDTFKETITGQSRYLDFIEHENTTVFKLNEDFDMAKQMQSMAFMPSLNESTNLFENFLGSIYGSYPFKHNDLGVAVYEKIANFVSNTADIDYCNINQIYDMAAKVGMDSEDFRLNFPPDVQRIIDYASINQSRLLGARSLQETSYTTVNNQNVVNRGDLISSLCYRVTAGTPVILKDKSINKYKTIQTAEINGCVVYTLEVLANFIGLSDYNWPSYYEFYEFIPSYDNKQLEGLIDWENPQTTINENLSTSKYWFGAEGFLDTELSYELYKGLGLI